MPDQLTQSANDLVALAQPLLDQVKADLNLTQGEVIMLIPDMPNVPPQNAPVMIAQANQAQAADKTSMRTLGVCFPAPSSPEHFSLENVFDPKMSARYYLRTFENKTITYDAPATITVLQNPEHGVMRSVTEADRGILFDPDRRHVGEPLDPAFPSYAYLPTDNYLGKDKAILLVDFGNGLKVKLVYYFQAIEGLLGNTGLDRLCSGAGDQWKISSNLSPDGTSTITSVEYQSPTTSATGTTVSDTAAQAATLGASVLTGEIKGAWLEFPAISSTPANP